MEPTKYSESNALTVATLGTIPRYVLLPNLISRSAHSFSATALKLTAMAMAMIPYDFSILSVEFTFSEFCKALGYERGGESFKQLLVGLKECVNKTISIQITSETTGKSIWKNFPWFIYSEFDEETNTIKMTLSPHLAATLIASKREYAEVNLKDIGFLQSRFAIRVHEIAISYMSLQGKGGNKVNEWYFERSIQDLRHLLGITEDRYKKTKDFRQYVVEKPIEEINSTGCKLEIIPQKIKQGRKLAGIKYECKKTIKKTQPKKRKAPQDEFELPGIEPLNHLERSLELLKAKYPEEFARRYAEKMAQPSYLPSSSEIRQIATENIVLNELMAEYGLIKS